METTNKCSKKSTNQQLQTLVRHMEANPEFTRGSPVFGASKRSAEEEWKELCLQINSLGPPMRSLSEWKKTWADLKSRTKKKVAENRKSPLETGGGLYRQNHLTELKEIIHKTLFFSSAVPSGKVFGDSTNKFSPKRTKKIIDNCFQSLLGTPPRHKAVAVIAPSPNDGRNKVPQATYDQQQQKRKSSESDTDNAQASCSSSKRAKSSGVEQLRLIRRQKRVAEQIAATGKEQLSVSKRAADAAEAQAEAAKRSAAAAEETAASMKRMENILRLWVQSM